MQYGELGRTGISISRICLGTMTFGEQNGEAEAFRLLDRAVEKGVTFFDTAEMYPIPPSPETCGRSEEIVGRWIADRGNRQAVVLATKISGPGWDHIRGGDGRLARRQIREALDGSLRRLRTDTIDLYQVHWPERKTNVFGRRGYVHDATGTFTPLAETLDALAELIGAGKVRAVGVSNETPWGVMGYLALAERDGLPRIASVQNPYSLLNRLYEVGLAEISIRERCGLLAYSPLAMGTLSGKYLDGRKPSGARLTLFPDYQRYTKPRAVAATEGYVALARRFGLDPAQMALAYVYGRRFLTSMIIGATTIAQLESDLAAAELTLEREVIDGIEAIHQDIPDPAP